MKKCLLLPLVPLLVLAAGCEKDYDIDKKLREDYKPQVVLNSVISPERPVWVILSWSKRYDDKGPYQPVLGFDITLFEDGIQVEKYEECNSIAIFNFVPSEGRSYRIEAEVPGYGTVRAETSVPKATTGKISFLRRKGYFAHFQLDEVAVAESRRAVWIRPVLRREDEAVSPYDLYSMSPFPDQINSFLESEYITDSGSNIVYEYFIRIPRMNIEACVPLGFSFESRALPDPDYPDWEDILDWDEYGRPIIGWDNDGNPVIYEKPYTPTITDVNLITPSDEYDKYYRLLYKQELFNYEADFPIFSETVQVFSNVENGLGIFAGYSIYTKSFEPDPLEL